MPIPRESYTNTVEQRPYGRERLQPGNFGAAGEAVGNAVAGFGRDMDTAQKQLVEIKQQQAEEAARENDLAAQAVVIQERVSYLNLKGKEAVEAGKTLPTRLQQIRAEHAEKIKDPWARKLFMEVSQRRAADELPQILEHAAKEDFKYKDGLDVAQIETAHNDGLTSMDPAIVAANKDQIAVAAARRAKRAGITDPEGVAIEQRAATGKYVLAIASNMQLTQHRGALLATEYVQQAMRSGDVDPDDAVKWLTTVAPAAMAEDAKTGVLPHLYPEGQAETPAAAPAEDRGENEPNAYRTAVPTVTQKPLALWEGRGVNSDYGVTRRRPDGSTRQHKGMDLNFRQGEPIPAAMDGVVTHGNDPGGWGRFILIDHGKDAQGRRIQSRYAHLSGYGIGNGQMVKQGQSIGPAGGRPGTSGAGNSGGEHLHYEFLVDGVPQDPKKFAGIAVATNIGGGSDRPAGPATAGTVRPKPNLSDAIASIEAAGYPAAKEAAYIARAKEVYGHVEYQEKRTAEAVNNEMYKYINTLGEPDDFVDFESQTPANIAMNMTPEQVNYWKRNAASNRQRAEAERKADIREAKADRREARAEEREIRGEMEDRAIDSLLILQRDNPEAFLKIDFNKQFPELSSRQRIQWEDRRREEWTSRNTPGQGIDFPALRSTVGRMRAASPTFAKNDPETKTGRLNNQHSAVVLDKAIRWERNYIKNNNGKKPTQGEREAFVASLMMPTTLATGETVPRAVGGGQPGAKMNLREELRLRYMRENEGVPPLPAVLDEMVRRAQGQLSGR